MRHLVVMAAMQVAMNPQRGAGQERVVVIAKTRGARHGAITRIGAFQAGREMGDDDGAVPLAASSCEFGLQPGAAHQGLATHCSSIERRTVQGGSHHAHVVARGTHRLVAQRGTEQVEVAPACGADEANASAARVGEHAAFALQHRERELRAALAQGRPGLRNLAAVELMVAGDKQHRHRPAAKALQPGPAAVDVAGQHQQLGAGRRLGLEDFGFEVQVGQDLKAHAAIEAQAAP